MSVSIGGYMFSEYFARWPLVSQSTERAMCGVTTGSYRVRDAIAHPVLELLAEDAAARMPDPQAGAELGAREEIELAAESAMVAFLGLLELRRWSSRSASVATRCRRSG